MSGNIVEGWLRSLNLVQYTQSFLDNGYDDLEVCKQIGEADLDAIGVQPPEDRERLLRAVRVLKEEGGTAVYFTLEETAAADPIHLTATTTDVSSLPLRAQAEDGDSIGGGGGSGGGMGSVEAVARRLDAYDVGKSALLTYPRVQLAHILKDKLHEDDVDLGSPPYTTSELRPCRSSLMALAIKYAEDLKTHFADVIERLEELWQMTRAHENYTTMCNSPVPHLYGGNLYGLGARTAPPPLPSCPPPSTSHVDRQLGGYVRGDNYAHQNYVAMDGDGKISTDNDSKKKGSAFGKFLRNIGFRRSGKKSGYKQHQGDPNAYEISMSEEDRIALMVMVKEGTISTETALEVVRRFEDDKRKEAFSSRDDDSKENVDMQVAEAQAGRKNTGKKKKSGSKPIKSQSAVYSGDGPRCHICRQIMLAEGYEVPVPPQVYGEEYLYECCRHRRVHSVGHIEMQNSVHSPQFSRALSCSPTSRHPGALPLSPGSMGGMGGPVHHGNYPRIYSPILAQAPPPPRHPGHPSLPPSMELIRERISGKAQLFLPKTTSRTSLLSSESECSDYVGQAQLRADYAAAHNEAVASCSQSTLSMSSENSQAVSHYHTLNDDHKHRIHRPPFHRSASCSPGDDGGSSENEDHDNIHLLGADFRGESSWASAKLSGRLKDMKSELKRKVMRAREARPSGENGSAQGEVSSPHLPNRSFHRNGRNTPTGELDLAVEKQYNDVIARATVHTDFTPAKHEKDFLTLKKGDMIDVTTMGEAGVWMGRLAGQLGKFPPSHVAIIQDGQIPASFLDRPRRHRDAQKARPQTVEELLHRIGLQHLTNVFMSNGFDLLETFSELDENDLDTLGIQDHDHRAKLLTAAQLMRESSESYYGYRQPGGQQVYSPLYPGGPHGHGMSSVQSASAIYSMGHHRRAHHRHLCRTCGKPKIAAQASVSQSTGTGPEEAVAAGSGEKESERSDRDTDKSDREYTEEDKEVCAITKAGGGSRPAKGTKVSGGATALDKAPACAGGNVISPCCHACIYASTSAASGTILPSQNYSDGDYGDVQHPDLSFIYGLATQPRQKVKPAPPPRLPGVSVLSSPGSGPASPNTRKRDTEVQAKDSNRSPSGRRSKTPSQESPHSPRSSSRKESPYGRRGGSSNDESPYGRRGFPSGDESHYGRCRVHHHSCDESPYARRVAHPQEENPYARRVGGSCEESPYGRCRVHSSDSDGKSSVSSQPPAVPLYGSGQWTLTESMYSSGHLGISRRTSSDSPHGSCRRKSGDGPHVPGHSLYLSGHRSISESGYNQAWGLKNVSRSLIPLVTTKLSAEKIVLSDHPYTTETGGCGVPPLLVQRYAEELRQDLDSIALVLEHVRMQQLQQLGRPGVPNERLAELCGTACDLRISSVGDFLTSIGLPMYADILAGSELGSLERLLGANEDQLSQATGADSRHLQRLVHALDWVRQKLSSPTRARGKGDNFTDKV